MTKQRRTSRVTQQIDENLRRVYSETAQEPVPDRFTDLLEKLRQQEKPEDTADNETDGTKS
nr:NepR family anti-sigma factor [Roseovarius lutimaris]